MVACTLSSRVSCGNCRPNEVIWINPKIWMQVRCNNFICSAGGKDTCSNIKMRSTDVVFGSVRESDEAPFQPTRKCTRPVTVTPYTDWSA